MLISGRETDSSEKDKRKPSFNGKCFVLVWAKGEPSLVVKLMRTIINPYW